MSNKNRPIIKTKHNTFPKKVTITAPLTSDERQMYETLAYAEVGTLQARIADIMVRCKLVYQNLQAIRDIQNEGYPKADESKLIALTQINVGYLNEMFSLIQSTGGTHDQMQQDMSQLISETPTRTFDVEKINCTTIDINVNGLRLQNYELSNFDAETIKEIRRQCSN
jgi:hypothetical protein